MATEAARRQVRRASRQLRPGEGRALVIFDADDTLWFTEPLYDDARDTCRAIVEAAGLDGDSWERIEREIDVANVARFGLHRDRFPTSCLEALAQVAGSPPEQDLRDTIWVAATQVFRSVARPANGVPEVIEELAVQFRLVLLTQGDPVVQEKRVSDAGLKGAFSDTIVVRDYRTKTRDDFLELTGRDGRNADRCWSVGNSVASDINPALQLGMNAIWIPAHVWEHEMRESDPHPGRVFTVGDLFEVQRILITRT